MVQINTSEICLDIVMCTCYTVWAYYYFNSWNKLDNVLKHEYTSQLLFAYMVNIFLITFVMFKKLLFDIYFFGTEMTQKNYENKLNFNSTVYTMFATFIDFVCIIIMVMLSNQFLIFTTLLNCYSYDSVLCASGKIGASWGMFISISFGILSISFGIIIIVVHILNLPRRYQSANTSINTTMKICITGIKFLDFSFSVFILVLERGNHQTAHTVLEHENPALANAVLQRGNPASANAILQHGNPTSENAMLRNWQTSMNSVDFSLFKHLNIFDKECVICMQNFTECGNSNFVELKCGHQFHEQCINIWTEIKHNPNCPICRAVVNTSHDQSNQIIVSLV